MPQSRPRNHGPAPFAHRFTHCGGPIAFLGQRLPRPAALTTAMPGGNHVGGILRYLTVAGLTLLALMMSLEPDIGFVAPPAARLVFWSLQIATGIAVLQTALYLLTRRFGASRVPSWALVLASAVLGAVLLAPIYWLIGEGLMQRWLGYPAAPDDEDLTESTPFGALLAEYFDIVGPLTTAWALICLPRLHWLVPPLLHDRPAQTAGPAAAHRADAPANPPADAAETPGHAGASPPEPATPDETPRSGGNAGADTDTGVDGSGARPAWCERLPKELGADVIAVASELQNHRVWTTRGCALILGALADVESAGEGSGLRVHRSWWVAAAHVRTVRRTSTGAVCVMSDGRHVPVSRRRRAEVLARFGDGAQYRVAAASEAVANPDLH